MKKIILFLFIAYNLFANNYIINLRINNIYKNKGNIYLKIFNSKKSYKRDIPLKQFILSSDNNEISKKITLPNNYYLFSVFQDINNNKKLDKNFLGIPKEPVGLSNYNGKGIPGGFDKLKIYIDKNSTIEIKLKKI
ncbi:uncharacterized protein (DUF2141 family) [Hypnocyclicus thermotrophus]|uniref:Uncharacterized protein (DUF2141 family) n=1 Tax=Hypnocyclicus thermotrophus TaxID=1627895 RepID=A0AA46DXG3_9FUSO|nr:DUF2141 domain-containing protein [Hypnocyclicus thermotrophus]TDT68022.1 uncharacterized protein (DUF2141 family) [Hypnocyclicus thermotrophus]